MTRDRHHETAVAASELTGDPLPEPDAAKRKHKATYATDKRKGGYLIRVEGPHAGDFVGREVPVTTREGSEHLEKLSRLLWSGTDKESGKPVALYAFESRPRSETPVEF